jgi:phosphopantetheinyl transferase
VLARYLDVAPAEVEFTYSREGKPGVTGIQFNLAHCEDLFVAAVSNVPVGIDIERPGTTTPALAKRILTTRELARWRRLSSSERRVALTRAWVRKEACAKALGGGARDDFMWSEVGLHQSQGFRRVRVEPASVSLADLDAVPDHIAAVAVVSSVAPLMSVHLVDYESPHLPSLAASFEPAEIAADDEGAEKRIAVVARNV